MFRLGQLFWKIALSLWLVCTVLILLFIILISNLKQSEHFKQLMKTEITMMSQGMIDHYENDEMDFHHHWRRNSGSETASSMGFGSLSMNSSVLRRYYFTVTDNETGELVVGRPKDLERVFHKAEFSITSFVTGKTYRVVGGINQLLRGKFMERIRWVSGIQLALTLGVSAVASLILTFMITRPLKQLGLLAQGMANSDFQTRVEEKLLQRKDEIGDLARDFNFLAVRIDTLINSKQALLRDVSHELRAPLARLQVAAALLERKNGESSETSRIERECERLNVLIGEILNLSRLDETIDDHHRTPLDIVSLIEESINNTVFSHPEMPIEFHYQQNESYCILGDERAFQRIIDNLLMNACKHTPKGTLIEVLLAVGEEANSESSMIQLIIRDHGSGVPEEDLDLLTDPFYRAQQKTHTEGFGLGLAIVKKVVDQLGGQLFIRNHPEGGLEAKITFERHYKV